MCDVGYQLLLHDSHTNYKQILSMINLTVMIVWWITVLGLLLPVGIYDTAADQEVTTATTTREQILVACELKDTIGCRYEP